jgi:hypothetical protein
MATGLVLSAVWLGLIAIKMPRTTPIVGAHTVNTSSSPTASPQPTPAATPSPRPTPTPPLPYKYANPVSNGLITNEFAFFNAGDAASRNSPDFEMTSGSLYGRGGDFWTGNPASCDPDPTSSNCTNSDVFRLDTKQRYSGNIAVTLALMQLANIFNPNCDSNDTCWYGTHIWLRYQNEFNLYYISVNRADGQVVIKRKVPCGPDNDGTYFVLGSYVPHSFTPNAWSHYRATIQTDPGGSVTLNLYDTDASSVTPVITGTDRGGTNPNWSPSCTTPGHFSSAGYPPITNPGGIGIRGDYSNFVFRDLTVSAF